MKMLLHVKIIFILFSLVQSDWVKISSDSPTLRENDMKLPKHNDNSLFEKFLAQESPSKEWIAYQKERFQNFNETQEIQPKDEPNTRTKIMPKKLVINKQTQSQNVSEVFSYVSHHPHNDTMCLKNNSHSNKKYPQQQISSRIDDQHIHTKPKVMPKSNTTGKYLKGFDNSQPSSKTIKATPRSAFHGFFDFMKSLQKNLISNTARTIQSKIGQLKKLRDAILLNIEDRVIALWPKKSVQIPKKLKKSNRLKRGIFDQSQSHFPSAATALLTINFLTFAVFLIKLVLQIINTLKSRHYSINGLTVNTVEALKVARKKRNAYHFQDNSENHMFAARIMNSIETYGK